MTRPPQNALSAMLDRALEFIELKDLHRTGWVLRGIDQPESVADHSWGTAMLCLLYAPFSEEELDQNRAVTIALVHDLAEVEVGDIPRRVSPGIDTPTAEEKSDRERRAIERLTESAPDDPASQVTSLSFVRETWKEYEEGVTAEARFVRDMNLIDMCLQALLYERDRRYDPRGTADAFPDFEHLDEFFATARSRFVTKTGTRVYQLLEARYQKRRFV